MTEFTQLANPADASQVGNLLPGDAVIVMNNITFTGDPTALRLLSQGHTITGPGGQEVSIGRGIFLTTGGEPGTTNTEPGFSVSLGAPGDPDLDAAALAAFPGAGQTEDAAVLEFTVDIPAAQGVEAISFDIVFGSDEFPEFSNSSFVDIAAIFVNGVNYALFNGAVSQPLSVIDTNITLGNFIDNQFGGWSTEYDGFSPKLTILAPVSVGTNTIKIGVADTGDQILDSGLFVSNVRATTGGGTGVFTPVVGTPSGGTLQGSAVPEIFTVLGGNNTILPGLGNDVINLGVGLDQIVGTLQELSGDVVNVFGTGDALNLQNLVLTLSQITITQGSAIIDIDEDSDGFSDGTITLSGDYANAALNLQVVGGDSVLSFNGVDQTGGAAAEALGGSALNDRLVGNGGNDTLEGGDGADTLNGGDGDDSIMGGTTAADLRDLVFAGGGHDFVDGGHGNDELHGMGGNDTLAGGFGVDSLFGGDGDDVITGAGFSDLVFGGSGNDFVNGGFGSDRVNGGTGADRFFHLGIQSHGSDWIQDYVAADGDVLLFGQAGATADQFQVNVATTAGAGDAGVAEAFVIYRPTGQIMWALVDGMDNGSINLQIAGNAAVFDLLA